MITKRVLQIQANSPDRPRCAVEGCNNLALPRSHKQNSPNGKRRYNKYCSTHHKQIYGIHQSKIGEKKRYRNYCDRTKCSLCGWLGPCDSHRVVWGANGGKYKKGNLISVCPNCHRLIHLGKIEMSLNSNLPLPFYITSGKFQ